MRTHRELYPEQYSDPRVGCKARLTIGNLAGRVVTIERFVYTRFGQLMIAAELGEQVAFGAGDFELLSEEAK